MSNETIRATVYVRLKREVLDPQGSAVARALATIGIEGVRDVRIGKLVELEVDPTSTDRAALEEKLARIADELLANPVIEDYEIVLHEP